MLPTAIYPGPTLPSQEFVRFDWPPSPRFVGGQRGGTRSGPISQDPVDYPPGQLDLVGAGKEGCVALQSIQQQALLRFWQRARAKVFRLVELHVHGSGCHAGAGFLGFAAPAGRSGRPERREVSNAG